MTYFEILRQKSKKWYSMDKLSEWFRGFLNQAYIFTSDRKLIKLINLVPSSHYSLPLGNGGSGQSRSLFSQMLQTKTFNSLMRSNWSLWRAVCFLKGRSSSLPQAEQTLRCDQYWSNAYAHICVSACLANVLAASFGLFVSPFLRISCKKQWDTPVESGIH